MLLAVNVLKNPLRFYLTLAETYPKSTFLRMMEKHDKSTIIDILQVFGTLPHVECEGVFRN